MTTINCHNDICNLWTGRGANVRLARDMQVPANRVWRWRQQDDGKGFIPPWYWTRLIEVVEHRHNIIITHGQLARMTEHRARYIHYDDYEEGEELDYAM